MPSIDEQIAILMRGVKYADKEEEDRQIRGVMEKELRQRLAEGRPLRVYCGFDPTGGDLTLGHSVPFRKLRQFQDLGHEVIFLIGGFTGLIGDPSDRDAARTQQTPEQVAENARTYFDQACMVLERDKTTVMNNADWLSKLTFADVIKLASNFTVQQFLAQEKMSLRMDKGNPIWLHEFFYALMQGYDAVAMHTDIQVGGTEQLFNLMAGRKLQEVFGQRPQVVLTLPILVGTDGHQRMGKSRGNYIAILEPPEVKFGKTMSIPDEAMHNWAELVTRWTPQQIEDWERGVREGRIHPMDAKKALAHEIVAAFHGEAAADEAQRYFERTYQEQQTPQEIPEVTITGPERLLDLIARLQLAKSKSEIKRLFDQGGVKLDNQVIHDINHSVSPSEPHVLQVGRHKFIKLISGR